MAHLRIGSRGSQLALWQANHIAALLNANAHTTSIDIIKTTGDKITDVALSKVGTKGMFTKEIEEALRDGHIDLAVHSLKDLPTELDPAFTLGAILEREDPRDAFVSRRFQTFADLPANSMVGTSSLRRQAQLQKLRPDLRYASLRGNVDTRLKKLDAGEFDSIILAAAGLRRLGLTDCIRQYFPVEVVCPAAGQGALAIEMRTGDRATAECVASLDHDATRTAVTCERALLSGLGGGCQVPIGAHGIVSDSGISLHAVVARPDGSEVLCESQYGTDARNLGTSVADLLLKKGAQRILDDVYRSGATLPEQP
ncbi:MAG TPA: hydroxymethylbilane synthase [Terriglobales bacterium]|nr:hydroxymethylbilane synthase [Terriglobales bacterium]